MSHGVGAPALRLYAAIAVGGALGAYLRLGIAEVAPVRSGQWPWATFIANLAGAFILAHVATRLMERLPPSAHLRPFLGTGLCGALTTFSTLQVEVIGLWRAGDVALSVAYYATSILAGLAAVLLATGMARRARLGIA